MINPHRITVALDRAKLFGPTADAKVGAVEPDLDNWEAGRSQPNPQQLARLAALANVPVTFFDLPDDAEPKLIVARVRAGRHCELVVAMDGEPADQPRPSLFDAPEVP